MFFIFMLVSGIIHAQLEMTEKMIKVNPNDCTIVCNAKIGPYMYLDVHPNGVAKLVDCEGNFEEITLRDGSTLRLVNSRITYKKLIKMGKQSPVVIKDLISLFGKRPLTFSKL